MSSTIRCGLLTAFVTASTLALAGGKVIFLNDDLGAWGLSPDGRTIVGARSFETYDEAMKWTQDRGVQLLGFGGGTRWSEAFAISQNGTTIVGQTGDGPAVWTAGSGMRPLPALSGYYGHAVALSANGSVIVGDSQSSRAQYVEATRWKNGLPLGLGDLPGGDFLSWANGVTRDGLKVVGTGTVDYGFAPFVWTEDTGMMQLSESGGASAISADGKVIVGSKVYDAERWTPFGEDEVYHTVIGRSGATACSHDGRIVGGFADYSPNTSTEHAFIWIEGRGSFDLRDYAASRGVSFGAYRPIEVTGISDDGLVICGWADSANGGRAFLLTFRTPSLP